MDQGVFEQVADAVRAMVPSELGVLRTQARQWGVKAWFDTEACPRAHYEAQVIGARHVAEADVLAIEVGFHAEHRKPADNDAVLAPLLAARRRVATALGPEAVAGPFLGRDGWLRYSETWCDPDLGDDELCFELADRLATYVETLEPLRTDPR